MFLNYEYSFLATDVLSSNVDLGRVENDLGRYEHTQFIEFQYFFSSGVLVLYRIDRIRSR